MNIFLFLLSLFCSFSEPERVSVRRFALTIGKGDGGARKIRLRYAASDAQSFANVIEDLGGVSPGDSVVILNPNRREFFSQIREFRTHILASGDEVRKELFFYYSGHSDETGLLLGTDKITYKELRKTIGDLGADISILILDSCASGSVTRLKGGKKHPSFLNKALSNLKGNVILTSASADEAAQESDTIQGSFFTHFLISGMRGAADLSGDGRVTLNEAYQYAYAHTLARTVKTAGGAQHASYSIQLTGNGELILTELKNMQHALVLSSNLLGRLFIHSETGKVVAEIEKNKLEKATIGLDSGEYTCYFEKDKKLGKAVVDLSVVKTKELTAKDFTWVEKEVTESRGNHERKKTKMDFSQENISQSRPWRAAFAGTLKVNGESWGGQLSLSHRFNVSAVNLYLGLRGDRDYNSYPVRNNSVGVIGCDYEIYPLRVSLGSDAAFELGVLGGGYLFLFNAPNSLGAIHLGSRTSFEFNSQTGGTFAFRIGSEFILFELGAFVSF